ncbi:putative uncharacterized protein [Prevotella sp. CAG:1058]|nr:putative uncharacterized protein [Prevotella sp. CAG:1058]
MRKLFTLVVLVAATLVTIPAQAQFKFGLKGGLNLTDMSFSVDDVDVSNRAGFFIGPTAKFTLPIVGLGLDASVLYDQREAKLKGTDDKIKQQAINIPINLRYDIGLGSLAAVYLAAGPQFGFNIGDKHQTLVEDVSEWKLNDSNFSVNVGLGVMLLGHLQVGANYNIVCGKTGEVTVIDGVEEAFRGRSNTWQISAAYYF